MRLAVSMRAVLAVACLAVPAPGSSEPQGRAGALESASRATIFLRVIGDIDVTRAADALRPEVRARRTDVEVSTGSGFIISPLGQVLTCHHVVADGERTGVLDGLKVTVVVKVRRIEAFVPAAPGSALPAERYEASVTAANPDLDLAVLSISGATFPTADFGDSDALEPGDSLDALGFPFGTDVEIGRPATSVPPAPEVSVSHGDFSAFRTDGQGSRRFIQTSALVNPGNSGGPVLDADGFVVGIVSRRLSGTASGIGFAVPINLVKDFLEASGLDGQLPARRLALGSVQSFDGKGVRMRVPWGVTDTSPYRARLDSGGNPLTVPTLRVDRVLSPWDILRLADGMSSGSAVESFAPIGPAVQRVRVVGGRRIVTGRVSGMLPDGQGIRVEYVVMDLGQDVKLLARYVGPTPLVAYNASAFRASLASIEGDLLRKAPVVPDQVAAWVQTAAAGDTVLRQIVMPAGWFQEPLAPLTCHGLAGPLEAAAASPSTDFTRTLRAGLIRQPGLTAADAAAACGAPGTTGAPDYQASVTSLGASLYAVGRFVQMSNDQVLHLEAVGPADQRQALQELFRNWLTRLFAPGR